MAEGYRVSRHPPVTDDGLTAALNKFIRVINACMGFKKKASDSLRVLLWKAGVTINV